MSPFSINPVVEELGESPTVSLADRVRRLRAAGKEVIGLQTGDPDFETPAPIVEAAFRSMERGETHYADSRGLGVLREAISDHLQRDFSVQRAPADEILISQGGIHAIYCALGAVLQPGDQVLVPDPAWNAHAQVVLLHGGDPVRVPSRVEDAFLPTPEAWSRALSPKVKGLILNSPNNPTGGVASASYLERLVGWAAEHDLWIVSDEVYHAIVFDGMPHASVAAVPGGRERTLLVNSFSKTYAMTGWRIGYLAGPSRWVNQALKVSQHTITNVAPFVQHAAVAALTHPSIPSQVNVMRDTYQARRDQVLSLLQEHGDHGLVWSPPQGAFYLFFGSSREPFDSIQTAEALLEETGTAVVPGMAYGPCGEGYLRISLASSSEDLEQGVSRIVRWFAERDRGHGSQQRAN